MLSLLCLRIAEDTADGWRTLLLQGRTTVRTTDATGVEETRETLHGLTKSEAQAFDAEWAKRGGPGNPGDGCCVVAVHHWSIVESPQCVCVCVNLQYAKHGVHFAAA